MTRNRSFRPARFLFALLVAALISGCAGPRDESPEVEDTVSLAPSDTTFAADSIPEASVTHRPDPPEGSAEEELLDATNVLQAYYAAINDGAPERAYVLWADSGGASGQTFTAFSEGYSQTAEIALVTGAGTIEGAAGSRYAEIPVRIEAVTRSGVTQRFEGSYVLRRSVVDGASAEQRSWRIYSADLRELR